MHVGTSRAFVLVGMCPALALSGPTYAPRRTQETVLYRVLQEHLETFVERTETGGRELPGFVKKELRAFLECGVLELTASGSVRYHFKRPKRNGTALVEYSPLEFLERLVSLVPLPRLHLIHFHGVLAPRSRLRARVVPTPRRTDGDCGHQTSGGADEEGALGALGALADDRDPLPDLPDFPARQLSKKTWAELLARTFGIDGLKCPECPQGRMRIVAFITNTETIRKILLAVGLPTEPPRPAPARPPPQESFDFS